jgi:hypothetical protein
MKKIILNKKEHCNSYLIVNYAFFQRFKQVLVVSGLMQEPIFSHEIQ